MIPAFVKIRALRWRLACLAVALNAAYGQEAEPSVDAVVELPPLVISASSKEPHWRYVDMPGFQILSSCSDRVTKDFAETHFLLHQTLRELLPDNFLLKTSTPQTLILVSESHNDDTTRQVMAETMRTERDRELKSRLQSDLTTSIRTTSGAVIGPSSAPPPQTITRIEPRIRFLPNLRLWDRDSIAIFSVLRESDFSAANLRLAEDHVRLLVQQRTPPLPRWFVDGALMLYEKAQSRDRTLTLPPFTWISDSELTELRRNIDKPDGAMRSHALLPMADVFTGRLSLRSADVTNHAAKRRAQSALFIRWCLDPKEPARKQALWKMIDGATFGPITEHAFRENFGLSYADLETQLALYLAKTATRRAVRLTGSSETMPAIDVRSATTAEIARVRGDWERLVIGFVKAKQPTFVERYAKQARGTVQREYKSGERDPRLLAVMGLLECDTGNDEAARPLLEAAVEANVPRPRIYVELARIRLATALAESPGEAEARLDPTAIAHVLKPLFAARRFAPPLSETYELIARTWNHSAAAPRRDHLNVLDEGVHLFPGDSRLIYQTAALQAKHGFHAEARALLALGERTATDETTRARFVQLQAALQKN